MDNKQSVEGRGLVVNLKVRGAGVKSIVDLPDWVRKTLVNSGYDSFVPKLAPLQD